MHALEMGQKIEERKELYGYKKIKTSYFIFAPTPSLATRHNTISDPFVDPFGSKLKGATKAPYSYCTRFRVMTTTPINWNQTNTYL